MFLCAKCIKKDKVKVLNKDYALFMIEIGRGSHGPCEKCKKTSLCADA